MGVRRCLARSLTSLALRCALQRVQTVPAAIHSGRIPSPQPTSTGTEDSASPLTTPDMVRSGRVLHTSVKSPSNSHIAQLRLLLSRRNLSIIRVKDVTVNTVMFRGV